MKPLLLSAVAGFVLAGCAPTLVPHTPYLPLMRDKGQVEAHLSTGLSGQEVQLGYQATSRLVLHASGLRYSGNSDVNNFRSGDVGVGYYWPVAAGRWRLGVHGGMAFGKGTSNNNASFCDGCSEGRPIYKVGYNYAYVQPTALLLGDARWSAGAGLRLGWANYQQFQATSTDLLGNPGITTDYSGHQSLFLQPLLQQRFQPLPWLALSTSTGFQFYVGPRNSHLNHLYPLVVQVGLHFIVGTKGKADK